MVALAGGTDAGGSIRIPSAWSGTVGFQPSAGRVPMLRPNTFGESTFIYQGPITRTAEDAALGMQAMASFDPRDPYSFPATNDFLGALDRGAKGMKIGFTQDFEIFPSIHGFKPPSKKQHARLQSSARWLSLSSLNWSTPTTS